MPSLHTYRHKCKGIHGRTCDPGARCFVTSWCFDGDLFCKTARRSISQQWDEYLHLKLRRLPTVGLNLPDPLPLLARTQAFFQGHTDTQHPLLSLLRVCLSYHCSSGLLVLCAILKLVQTTGRPGASASRCWWPSCPFLLQASSSGHRG